jgi:hypothetical protein
VATARLLWRRVIEVCTGTVDVRVAARGSSLIELEHFEYVWV